MTENDIILVAGAAPERVTAWEQALAGLGNVLSVRRFDALKQACARLSPQIVLLDLDLQGLEGPRDVATISNRNPEAKIVAFISAPCDETEIALFKSGVRGCALRNIEPELLKRIVLSVEQGELWIRRAITHRLLDEVRSRCLSPWPSLRAHADSVDKFAALTEREREIVELIGNFESNKHIARELCITERTVKAHVSRILRKLGVVDRIRLALSVAAHSKPEGERLN